MKTSVTKMQNEAVQYNLLVLFYKYSQQNCIQCMEDGARNSHIKSCFDNKTNIRKELSYKIFMVYVKIWNIFGELKVPV